MPLSNASVFSFVPALSNISACWHVAVGPGYCHGISAAECPAEIAFCPADGAVVLHLSSLVVQGNASVHLVFKLYHDCGFFDVKVGNTVVQTVDTFAPAPVCNWWKTAALPWPAGAETISIVATGQKNTSSTHSYVQIVGIQIKSQTEQSFESARSWLPLRTDDVVARVHACELAARSTPGGCFSFNGIAQLPVGPFIVPGYPDGSDVHPPVVVAPPCHNATAADTNCTKFATKVRAAPAFWEGGGGNTCYALGALSTVATTRLIDPVNASAGVVVTYTGGDGGRILVYSLRCDRGISPKAGPTQVIGTGLKYTVLWPTPLACDATLTPHAHACGPPLPPPGPVAQPSTQQLQWMDLEVPTPFTSACFGKISRGESYQLHATVQPQVFVIMLHGAGSGDGMFQSSDNLRR